LVGAKNRTEVINVPLKLKMKNMSGSTTRYFFKIYGAAARAAATLNAPT
jgi:hypothetical protein